MNNSELLARALWLAENALIDKRLAGGDTATAIMSRMEVLRFPDERTAYETVQRLLAGPLTLMDNCYTLNACLFEQFQGLPRMNWEARSQRIIRLIDPDTQLCLHHQLSLPAEDRYDWPAVPCYEGQPGHNVLKDGSVDTHIHLGGALPPLFYWLILMSGEVLIHVVSDFASSLRGYASAERWRLAISESIWIRMALARKMQEHFIGQAFSYLPPATAGRDSLWRYFAYSGSS